MMKTELKVIIHHSGPLNKKLIQQYVRDAVAGHRGGLTLGDCRRKIKKATFKHPPAIRARLKKALT